jgi:hypothetical protein
LCIYKDKIVTPINIVTEKPKVTIALALTAKEYGTLDIRLPINTYQNIA